MSDHEIVFKNIYENKIWGDNNETTYDGSSGGGSSVEFNINTYIPFLRDFIKENNINTIIDLGCGDFRCGKHIYDDLNINYYGYDVYDKIIKNNKKNNKNYNFVNLDFYNDKEFILSGDLCILKDVIQHWALNDIYVFLDYLTSSKKFKYILICNCCHQNSDNTDIKTGDFRGLSCNFYPLKKYNPQLLYKYKSKEVSIIKNF